MFYHAHCTDAKTLLQDIKCLTKSHSQSRLETGSEGKSLCLHSCHFITLPHLTERLPSRFLNTWLHEDKNNSLFPIKFPHYKWFVTDHIREAGPQVQTVHTHTGKHFHWAQWGTASECEQQLAHKHHPKNFLILESQEIPHPHHFLLFSPKHYGTMLMLVILLGFLKIYRLIL